MLAERARAAATEANRIPAYAAADPEVVTGAVRELRASGRWRDPRTLTHGSSASRAGARARREVVAVSYRWVHQ